VLVQTTVDDADFVAAMTDEGCVALGLPETHPIDEKATKWAGIAANPSGAQPVGLVKQPSRVAVPRHPTAREKGWLIPARQSPGVAS
jgi:hypothetical protein